MTAGERLIEQGVTERRLVSASVEQIETWGERVLSAVTLIELFAD